MRTPLIQPGDPMTSLQMARAQGISQSEATRLAKATPDGTSIRVGTGVYQKVRASSGSVMWLPTMGEAPGEDGTAAVQGKTDAMPGIHPLCAIWPDMDETDFAGLKDSIKTMGKLLHPVVMLGDQILDGRHRFRACTELGIKPETVQFDGDDPLAFVAGQHARRNLTSGQRSMIAAEMATRELGSNGHDPGEGGRIRPPSIVQAAKLNGVGTTSVKLAKTVLREAPELVSAVKTGAMSLEKAATRVAARKAETRKAEQAVVRHQKALEGDAGELPPIEQTAHDLRRMVEGVAAKARDLATVKHFHERLIVMAGELEEALTRLGPNARDAMTADVLAGIASATARINELASMAARADVIDLETIEATMPASGQPTRH